ncbi:hypothetical protein NX059_011328 [Plenodomus lindquistii]|nr:hypothetical protein NX059_011328 [Plenodomus lindquistii]
MQTADTGEEPVMSGGLPTGMNTEDAGSTPEVQNPPAQPPKSRPGSYRPGQKHTPKPIINLRPSNEQDSRINKRRKKVIWKPSRDLTNVREIPERANKATHPSHRYPTRRSTRQNTALTEATEPDRSRRTPATYHHTMGEINDPATRVKPDKTRRPPTTYGQTENEINDAATCLTPDETRRTPQPYGQTESEMNDPATRVLPDETRRTPQPYGYAGGDIPHPDPPVQAETSSQPPTSDQNAEMEVPFPHWRVSTEVSESRLADMRSRPKFRNQLRLQWLVRHTNGSLDEIESLSEADRPTLQRITRYYESILKSQARGGKQTSDPNTNVNNASQEGSEKDRHRAPHSEPSQSPRFDSLSPEKNARSSPPKMRSQTQADQRKYPPNPSVRDATIEGEEKGNEEL